MYEEWCDFCDQPRKCHNIEGELYCIACKQKIADEAEVST